MIGKEKQIRQGSHKSAPRHYCTSYKYNILGGGEKNENMITEENRKHTVYIRKEIRTEHEA